MLPATGSMKNRAISTKRHENQQIAYRQSHLHLQTLRKPKGFPAAMTDICSANAEMIAPPDNKRTSRLSQCFFPTTLIKYYRDSFSAMSQSYAA
jgi:hypothetical protein